tara:strand:+ start:14 stop:616 length:603 start_codon:yes stop_codon:yes gene_type:complete
MLSQKERLRQAKKDMDALRRMQSPNASVLMSSGNVVLPNESERTNIELSPEKIIVKSLGPQDDDMRLQISGVDIFNPQRNVSWYRDSVDLPPQGNRDWQTTGFRVGIVTRSQAIAAGADWALGATVNVDTFDGWANGYRTSPWIATVILNGGNTTRHSGGVNFSGSSKIKNQFTPPPPAGYFQTGPHFANYYSNGSFTLN